jgi:uncharacterized protein YjbI with pentapeptide repeats
LTLTGVKLSQAYISHKRTDLIGISLIGVQLSQAYIPHRRTALTGMSLIVKKVTSGRDSHVGY